MLRNSPGRRKGTRAPKRHLAAGLLVRVDRSIDLGRHRRVGETQVLLTDQLVVALDVFAIGWLCWRSSPALAAQPITIVFRKSGLRPSMPALHSDHVLIMLRRLTRSSMLLGWMWDRPTRSPEVGET
jgi:hypothetical protein